MSEDGSNEDEKDRNECFVFSQLFHSLYHPLPPRTTPLSGSETIGSWFCKEENYTLIIYADDLEGEPVFPYFSRHVS